MRYAGERMSRPVVDPRPAIPIGDGVRYPQDNQPAPYFGVDDPTMIPIMRDKYMLTPEGGISQMAPQMMDGYIDNQGLGPDTGLPYVVGPELQRQRRDSMRQFQSVPGGLLPRNLRGV